MSQSEPIQITGIITRDLQSKNNFQGDAYYYTFLNIENSEKDLPIFFWRLDQEKAQQLEKEIKPNVKVTVFGNYGKNNQEVFNVNEWKVEEDFSI